MEQVTKFLANSWTFLRTIVVDGLNLLAYFITVGVVIVVLLLPILVVVIALVLAGGVLKAFGYPKLRDYLCEESPKEATYDGNI